MRQQLMASDKLDWPEANLAAAQKQKTVAQALGSPRGTSGFLSGRSVCLQRSVSAVGGEHDAAKWWLQPGASAWPENAGTALVQGALAAPSRPLDEATRAFMEPKFGHDFSQVRVHHDESAAHTNRALTARAFTVGEHILFGAGQYSPGTETGKRMLAHELCHVVQQREGLVEGRPGPGGIKVGDPYDRFEHAADLVANRVMQAGIEPRAHDSAPVAEAGTIPRPTTRVHAQRMIVQRYLAGTQGHGGIEEEALQEAGLSPVEAKLAYYGNWLRDLSQIGDGSAMHELIRVLATGEFGRAPSNDEIGHYLASEHMDRPDKGGTAEDPYLSPQQRKAKIEELSGEQRRWVEEEQTARFRDLIQHGAEASGLPGWIEVGKEHAKRKLGEAVALGRTPEGLQALGNGLHAVEDYFSHSNFIEVALAQLVHEGSLPLNNPLVTAMGRYIGVDPANVRDRPGLPTVDKFGRPRIVTGTSVGTAATLVGLWETIKTEIKTGELANAFIRGLAIRYGRPAFGKAGGVALGTVGGIIGGAVGAIGGAVRWIAGAVGGLFAGAASGAAMGWHSAKHWWQKPFAAIGGLFGGAALGTMVGAGAFGGPAGGAVGGWRTGQRIGGAIGRGVFGTAGAAIFGALGLGGAALVHLGGRLLAAVDRTILGEGLIPIGTRASIRAAPYGSGPTHSQIAKDDPEHPLFGPSRALAHEADVQIGRAIIAAWSGTGPVQTRAAAVEALVDVYVAHPYAVGWWRSVLLPAARAAGTSRPAPHPIAR
jgi:hypothetical protein